MAASVLAEASGAEWATFIAALVSAAALLLTYLRPTKDTEARIRADGAVNDATEAKLLVDSAMAMAREAREEADAARERAGLAEARCGECQRDLLRLEREIHSLRLERDQIQAEAEGLAGIVDEKVIGDVSD